MSTFKNINDYKLDIFDTYSFLLIAPFSGLASLVLFLAHSFSKDLRKQPGDLILMISLTELLLSIHFFSVAYRTSYISTGTKDDSTFCQLSSVAAIVLQVMEFSYSVCFLVHIYFTMNSSIQKGFVPKKLYHVVTLVGVAVSLGVNHRNLGKDPYGICSLKVGTMQDDGRRVRVWDDLIYATVFLLVGVVLAIFVLIFTQKKLPNFGKELSFLKRDFLNYYKTYIKSCIMYWLIIFLSYCAQIFGEDQRIEVEEKHGAKGMIFEIGRIGNTAKVMIPLVFFFVRIQDPLIRKRIWSPFKSFTLSASTSVSQSSKEDLKSDENEPGDLLAEPLKKSHLQGELGDKNSDNGMKNEGIDFQQIETDTDDLMWMNLLPAKIKESYTRTFLACIFSKYEDKLEQKKGKVCTAEKDIQDICYYTIKGHNLMKTLKTTKSIINCKFTIYSPTLFKEILDSNFRKINIKESLDIFKNEERIKKAGESGGGASGELFMFSHDNLLILKTANHDEIQIFNKIMLDYKEHLKRNPGTQIAKIFGLFDFSFKESDKSIKLILMENLCTLNSEYILRKYDLKGSSHSRKVMKNYKDIGLDRKIEKIMKDLDFEEIDREIHIKYEDKIMLKKCIQADVDFFGKHEIIDYSLILAVVDRRGVESLTMNGEMKMDNPHILKSELDQDRVYYIGIIDYFQLYDIKKALERFLKRLSKCNPGLDTSSQPPKIYSARFSMFVDKIIK